MASQYYYATVVGTSYYTYHKDAEDKWVYEYCRAETDTIRWYGSTNKLTINTSYIPHQIGEYNSGWTFLGWLGHLNDTQVTISGSTSESSPNKNYYTAVYQFGASLTGDSITEMGVEQPYGGYVNINYTCSGSVWITDGSTHKRLSSGSGTVSFPYNSFLQFGGSTKTFYTYEGDPELPEGYYISFHTDKFVSDSRTVTSYQVWNLWFCSPDRKSYVCCYHHIHEGVSLVIPDTTSSEYGQWEYGSYIYIPHRYINASEDYPSMHYIIYLYQVGIKSYTITYNMNGGTPQISKQTYYDGHAVTLSSIVPTKTGYKFKSWNGLYSPGGTYDSFSGDVTLNAQYALIYAVRFDANGGSNAPANQQKIQDEDLVLSAQQPIRSGYNFLGWGLFSSSKEATYQPGDTYTENRTRTLYAVWETEIIIKFNGNGSTSGSMADQTKKHNVSVALQTCTYFRTGYKFVGWAQAPDGPVKYRDGGLYTENVSRTLYAIWEKVCDIVYYDEDGTTELYRDEDLTPGTTYTITRTATKAYYSFKGWTRQGTSILYVVNDTFVIPSTLDTVSLVATFEQKKDVEKFWWWGEMSDDIYVISGKKISDSITASSWNRLQNKVSLLYNYNKGRSISFMEVSKGQTITAEKFNQVASYVAALDGATSINTPGQGDTILASYYHGAGSIQNSLNAAIDNWNNS